MSGLRPKLDIDATREKLMALGCLHAAEHLDHRKRVLMAAYRERLRGGI